jgi:Flp pilus assembly protein TadG
MDVHDFLRRFASDERGAVAAIFGVVLLMLVFVVGVSIDTGSAMRASAKVANALDAAALAGARALAEQDLEESEVRDVTSRFFEGQFDQTNGDGLTWENLDIDVDVPNTTVAVSVDVIVPTTFSRVMNYSSLRFRKVATSTFKLKAIELAMVLDVTGSMAGQKIEDLKLAAEDVVSILLPDNTIHKNRIALVPYSAAVNAGAYAAAATDGGSTDGCVFEREGGPASTDDPPDNGRWLGFESDPAAPQNDHYMCPTPTVQPLTSSKPTLMAQIADLAEGGWTAGHIGAAWGWYTLSPRWSAVWPGASRGKPYEDVNTTKVMVLMTDGEFNTSYKNGPANETSTPQALELCTAIKDAGIKIYSVAFQSPPEAEETLRACASSESEHFFVAESGEQLRAAFRSIAENLQSLRLSQ